MYHFGFFNFCNGVSELQMELPNFLGYFNTFVFTVQNFLINYVGVSIYRHLNDSYAHMTVVTVTVHVFPAHISLGVRVSPSRMNQNSVRHKYVATAWPSWLAS